MTEPNHSDHELLVETLRRLYSVERAYHFVTSELEVAKRRLQQADYHADNDLADKVHELNTALEECKAELETLREDARNDKHGVAMATKQILDLQAELELARDDIQTTQEQLHRKSVDSRLLLDALDDYVGKAIRTYDFEYNMGLEDVDGLRVSGYLDLAMFSDILNGLLRDVAKGDDD